MKLSHRIKALVLRPFGYKPCRCFGMEFHETLGITNEEPMCYCFVKKNYTFKGRYKHFNDGRYCKGCAIAVDILTEEDMRQDAQEEMMGEYCAEHPEECECDEEESK